VELVTGSDPNAVWQKVWDEQQTALLAVRATAAAAKVQEEQGLQQGLQQQRQASELSVSQGATSPPLSVQQQAGSGGGGGVDGTSSWSVGSIPSSMAAAISGALARLPTQQQWLSKVVPMQEPPWGVAEFGFADAKLLQLLEGLEGVCV
jgi:hypothetical protein